MIHDAATGFSEAAGCYDRGRPDYPPEALRWLFKAIELAPGRAIVDLGAGTGKLTRHLVEAGASVVAVEPVAEMRAQLERALPGVATSPATAETIELAPGSLDAAVAGQAFHWFANQPALRRIHRLLRRGGHLGLIWNRRRLEQPLQARISELIEPYRLDAPRHAAGAWRRPLRRSGLFERCGEHTVQFTQALDRPGLIDRVGSISFIARLDPPRRSGVLEQVGELARGAATIELEYIAETFAFRAREPKSAD